MGRKQKRQHSCDTRIGRVGRTYEFVLYDEEEVFIKGIKGACEKHFTPSLIILECKGLSCDILAHEQGPSCHSMNS